MSVALLLGACSGPRWEIASAGNPAADYSAFKTYAFVPVERLEMTGSQMADPVTRRNIEATIARELEAKGLAPAPIDKASLLVSYFADVYQGVDKMRPINPTTSGANLQRQGKLTVDLIETADQRVVWHGEAWARDPKYQVSENVVAELVRRYPR